MLNFTAVSDLESAALSASEKSYSPYSHFRVGAAVLGGSGKIYAGSNVENASYGLCMCAERTAVYTAIAAGERELRCVVVYTPTHTPTAPCGACRQVLHEFGSQMRVISVCDSPERIDTALSTLLPGAFGPENLGSAQP